jgi:hypothetical protein
MRRYIPEDCKYSYVDPTAELYVQIYFNPILYYTDIKLIFSEKSGNQQTDIYSGTNYGRLPAMMIQYLSPVSTDEYYQNTFNSSKTMSLSGFTGLSETALFQ